MCQERLVVKFLILLKSNLGLSVILYNFQSLMSLIPLLSHPGHGQCVALAPALIRIIPSDEGAEEEKICISLTLM